MGELRRHPAVSDPAVGRRQLALIVPCNERGNASLFLDAILDLPPENWSRDNASFVG